MESNRKSKTQTLGLALKLKGLEERMILILTTLIVLFALSYVYFVGSAIVHAVVRKEVQDNVAGAHSEVAELEVVYLSQKNLATRSLAYKLGFTAVRAKRFAERHTTLGRAEKGVELE